MHTIDGRVLSYIPQPDHERAAQQPEVDEAGKTPAHALEWLLDSAAERIKAGDATLRPTCSAVRAFPNAAPSAPRARGPRTNQVLAVPPSRLAVDVEASLGHHAGIQ